MCYDADGAFSDIREYMFSEWGKRRSRNGRGDLFRQRTRGAQQAAKDDLAALRSRFDANGDGQLTGTEQNGFKVMVTGADGALTAQKAASLLITHINLTHTHAA